jgi:ubiquinone/menaquinone biosynthesis C-methylase UbiE
MYEATACGSGHMLTLFQSGYDTQRSCIGIDISLRMVSISKKRLHREDLVLVGDMRSLSGIDSGSIAAILNFFALHHLDEEGIRAFMLEVFRVLVPCGRLILAAWEGSRTCR